MSSDVAVADLLALGPRGSAPSAPTAEPALPGLPGRDRSPQSLALLLAKAAERVRTDPEANFSHCAVRGAADVLRARLDERRAASTGAARDATEGP